METPLRFMFDGMSYTFGLASGFSISIIAMILFDLYWWIKEKLEERNQTETAPRSKPKKKEIEVVQYKKVEK